MAEKINQPAAATAPTISSAIAAYSGPRMTYEVTSSARSQNVSLRTRRGLRGGGGLKLIVRPSKGGSSLFLCFFFAICRRYTRTRPTCDYPIGEC